MSLRRVIKRHRQRVWTVAVTVLFFNGIILNITFSGAVAQEGEGAMRTYDLIEGKKESVKTVPVEQREALLEELKLLEEELFQFPQKERFHFGQDSYLTYDSNVTRLSVQDEEGDTTFRINPFVGLDLSGRKTDLRVEYRWDRQYNVKRPGSDDFVQEISVRFNRKLLPKTYLSLTSRLNRSSVRSPGMDNKKITWDNAHRVTLNYEYNKKLSLNLETDYTRSDILHENFDQDSNYSFSLSPNLTFQATPKSRFTAGYRLNFTRVPTELSDVTNHEFRGGYSLGITPKSTLSADVTYTFKDPDSAQASRSDLVLSSLGYAWQATPKTSVRALYSNSFEHLLSDSVSGEDLLKTTTRTSSDTMSLSVRVRLPRKLTSEFSFNGSHSHTKTRKTGVDNTRSRTWTFPYQLALDFDATKWLRLRFTYTFRHRIGNERKTDEHRAHTWFMGCNVSF